MDSQLVAPTVGRFSPLGLPGFLQRSSAAIVAVIQWLTLWTRSDVSGKKILLQTQLICWDHKCLRNQSNAYFCIWRLCPMSFAPSRDICHSCTTTLQLFEGHTARARPAWWAFSKPSSLPILPTKMHKMVTRSNKHLHKFVRCHKPLNTWNNRSFWGGSITFSIMTSLTSLSNVIIVIIPSFTHTFLAQSFTRQELSFPTACWIAFHSIPQSSAQKDVNKFSSLFVSKWIAWFGVQSKKSLGTSDRGENATDWATEWGSTASVICRTQGWSGDALADILRELMSESKPASHSRVFQHTMETKTTSCGCVSLLENGQL